MRQRAVRRISVGVALAAMAVLAWPARSQPPPLVAPIDPEPLHTRMHAHFSALREVHRALLFGDLKKARRLDDEDAQAALRRPPRGLRRLPPAHPLTATGLAGKSMRRKGCRRSAGRDRSCALGRSRRPEERRLPLVRNLLERWA